MARMIDLSAVVVINTSNRSKKKQRKDSIVVGMITSFQECCEFVQ
jgi:hypothetical protein